MNMKKLLLGSVVVSALLALIRRAFAQPASPKPGTQSAPYDAIASCGAIDAYVEEQMRRLKIPGVSLSWRFSRFLAGSSAGYGGIPGYIM